MAIIIEAPNEVYSLANSGNAKLFLAGGITNCPDWQSWVVSELRDVENLTIYNPRRKKFDIKNFNTTEEQITWEYEHLRDANIVMFWFSKGSLNPMSLYELGMWGNSTDSPTLIGVDPQYERKEDVYIQTQLARPELKIFNSLSVMIGEIASTMDEVKRKIENNKNRHDEDDEEDDE